MTKKITIEYWAKTGRGENRCKHMFDITMRQDAWESMSAMGREQFIQEQLWDDLECGYRVVEPEPQITMIVGHSLCAFQDALTKAFTPQVAVTQEIKDRNSKKETE